MSQAGLQLPHDFLAPPPLPLWPWAPGVWLALGLLVLLLLVAVTLWLRHRRRQRPLRRALAHVDLLVPAWRHDPRALAHELSALLRLFASHYQPTVQTLSGEAWLGWLDSQLAPSPGPHNESGTASAHESRAFRDGPGRVFDHFAPQPPELDADALQALCRHWLASFFRRQQQAARAARTGRRKTGRSGPGADAAGGSASHG